MKRGLLLVFALTGFVIGCQENSIVDAIDSDASMTALHKDAPDGFIELKGVAAPLTGNYAHLAFDVLGSIIYSINEVVNVKQNAFEIQVVVEAELTPIRINGNLAMVYGDGVSMITADAKQAVPFEQSYYFEMDDFALDLVIRYILADGSISVDQMWIQPYPSTAVDAGIE